MANESDGLDGLRQQVRRLWAACLFLSLFVAGLAIAPIALWVWLDASPTRALPFVVRASGFDAVDNAGATRVRLRSGGAQGFANISILDPDGRFRLAMSEYGGTAQMVLYGEEGTNVFIGVPLSGGSARLCLFEGLDLTFKAPADDLERCIELPVARASSGDELPESP